ncbi:P-loop containing nucleoside triphosphate hydrolase protein [Cunninghamella echinulata]|nr:P-loop containing nucleoside triphosphate hydrolase protein [Cunninghamella echinulata]
MNNCILGCWIYMIYLICISSRYNLPNWWGGILNTHLFLLSVVSLAAAISRFIFDILWIEAFADLKKPWIHILPWLILLFIQLDMAIITVTIPYDLPYLEKKSTSTSTSKNTLRPLLPLYNTSLLYYMLYTYTEEYIYNVAKFMKQKKLINDVDLPGLPPQLSAYNSLQELNKTRGKFHSMLYRIYYANRNIIFWQNFYALLCSSITFAPPILMQHLLIVIEKLNKLDKDKESDTYNQLYIQIVLLILAQLFFVMLIEIITGLKWFYGHVLSVKIRQMFNVEIFYKTLRRPIMTSTPEDLQKEDSVGKGSSNESSTISTAGNIVNLISIDTKTIGDLSCYMFNLWSPPFELTIGLYLLYNLLGLSSLVGMLVMVIFMPITHYVSKVFSKATDDIMKVRDKRGNIINEMLRGIRQIKFFAWENQWKDRIMQLRKEELSYLYKLCVCSFINNTTWNSTPIFVIIATFSSFTLLEGKELTPSIAFTSIYIYSKLRSHLSSIPDSVIDFIRASVSMRRIEIYLQQKDIPDKSKFISNHNQSAKIGFENANIEWASINSDDKTTNKSSAFSLKNVNLFFPIGEFSLICGPTGSGKTLMLLGLLGEASCTKGSIYFPHSPIATQGLTNYESTTYNSGMANPDSEDKWILNNQVAYVSQSPWLQNNTIRENILFGLPYIQNRYNSTLWACGLNPDLNILANGDLTEIGERGITLSGGQKQRIALARAVYSRAKTILMDDVLTYTAKHLYENCLTGQLMKGRTRILVTHHVQICIQKCSFILHLDSGRVTLSGAPSELHQLNTLGNSIKKEFTIEYKNDINIAEEDNLKEQDPFDARKKTKENSIPHILIESECKRLYRHYLLLVGGSFFWILTLSLIIGTKGLELLSTWWLKEWSNIYGTESNRSSTNITPIANNTNLVNNETFIFDSSVENNKLSSSEQLKYYLGIYTLINLLYVIISSGQYLVIYIGGLRASKELFVNLLDRILHAPFRFFDVTPIGRILNRFSGDFDVVDYDVPTNSMAFSIILTKLVGIFVAILLVEPFFLIPLLLISYITLYYAKLFVDSTRESKRLESVSKSPLISHFTETLVGIATIRAFGATQSFLQLMIQKNDEFFRPYYLSQMCTRWASMVFAYIASLLIFIGGLAVLLGLDYHIEAGLVGFIFSYTLLFSDHSFWASYQYRRIEVSYNSVERVVEFTKIEQESNISTIKKPLDWPNKGGIEFQDLQIKYAPDLELVLKDINFKINPGEKIGIVGPTGCGKSTLTLSVFRFLEAYSGKIIIDNLDISTLALDELRSSLTIIPQDPVLFSGTVRSNVDPFNEFSDASILESLSRMSLIPAINPTTSSSPTSVSPSNQSINQNIFENLDSPIAEGGQNISAGQKQLICLAKHLLRRSKIVVMDEATSSVDFDTDRKIQNTIRSEFTDCTILCVAHRLFTVINYDKILVLDAGKVKEYDSPLNLISDPQSMFYKLCKNSGEFDQLFQAVQQ